MVYNGNTQGRYFEVKISTPEGDIGDQEMYRPFLETFGKKIVALSIYFLSYETNEQDHWLFEAIKDNCTSLTHVILEAPCDFDPMIIIRSVPKLARLTLKTLYLRSNRQWMESHHPHLQSFCVNGIRGFDHEIFNRFVENNPQLKHLHLIQWGLSHKIIQLPKGRLNSFKSLMITASIGESQHVEKYYTDDTVDGLESLTISTFNTTAVDTLRAIANECKLIKHLNIFMKSSNSSCGEIVDVICSFDQVALLTLDGFSLKLELLHILLQRLHRLTSLRLNVNIEDLEPSDILHLFTVYPNLNELTFVVKRFKEKILAFNINFFHQFVNIVRGRDNYCKFELCGCETKLVFTGEKFIMNGELRHWIGYEAERSHSKTNILTLNEACIGRITKYLSENDVRALYETCTLAKKVFANQIEAQAFNIAGSSADAKDLISRFGEHMKKIVFDLSGHVEVINIWSLIGRMCGRTLAELTIKSMHVNALSSMNLSFPELVILRLERMESDGPYVFPLMDCPKMNHLELNSYTIQGDVQTFQLGIPLHGLKVLKFYNFNFNMYKVLNELSDDICGQVEELTFNFRDSLNTLVINTAIRFRNLTTLNLITPNIERTDTKHLFKRCRKLIKLSLMYETIEEFRQMLKHVKENCKQLKVLQLVRENEYTTKFEERYLEYVSRLFPNIEMRLISHDSDNNPYDVTTYKKPISSYHCSDLY